MTGVDVKTAFNKLQEVLGISAFTEEFENIAPRPLKAGLKMDKIISLGINMRTVKEALEDMKKNKEKDDKYPE